MTIDLDEKDNLNIEGSSTKGNIFSSPSRNKVEPSLGNTDFDTESNMG